MPSLRPLGFRPLVRFAQLLLPACLLGSTTAALAQSATGAVSSVLAFSSSVPNGGVVLGPDGGLYGTTSSTSAVTGGLIYRASADGSSVTTIYQLQNTQAYAPVAGLLLGSDGLLYGTTTLGAISLQANTSGTVFRIKPDGTGFTVLHNFAPWTDVNVLSDPISTEGTGPSVALIQGSDGNLYGAARSGGANGTGTLFMASRDGTAFKVLHTFGAITSDASSSTVTNLDGATPAGALVQASDGYLYGTTSRGGLTGSGTVFRIALDGTGFETLHLFPALTTSVSPPTNTSGARPLAGLTDGGDGRLYGVTSEGGANGVGTVFTLDLGSRLLTVLHTFEDANGSGPNGALILGRDTKLYGTTYYGGTTSSGSASSLGTIFSIARDGTGFAKLHSFDSSNGSRPIGRLLQLSDTAFVGIASAGGKCGQGTLYQFSTTGAEVKGNTSCGQKKNVNGGGATGPWALLLLGLAGLARRRRRA